MDHVKLKDIFKKKNEKTWLNRPYCFQLIKDCLLQTLLDQFLNILSHLKILHTCFTSLSSTSAIVRGASADLLTLCLWYPSRLTSL